MLRALAIPLYETHVSRCCFATGTTSWRSACVATVTVDSELDVRARVQPITGTAENALRVKHDAGWEIDGAIGYDFGIFRPELEIRNKQASLSQVKVYDARVPIDSTSRPRWHL